jgi:hypothetical protein
MMTMMKMKVVSQFQASKQHCGFYDLEQTISCERANPSPSHSLSERNWPIASSQSRSTAPTVLSFVDACAISPAFHQTHGVSDYDSRVSQR